MMHPDMTLAGAGFFSALGIPFESVGIALALFVAGLVGSFSHCAGMCGPFVLAQSAANTAARSSTHTSPTSLANPLTNPVPNSVAGPSTVFARLGGAALLPYHLGRATTYVALGAAAASLTGALMMVPELRWLAIAFLALAGLAFLTHAVGGLPAALKRHLPARHLGARWAALVSRLARPLFASPRGLRGYFLGVALGFIPCGLLYAALAVAAASASPVHAAIAMAAFVLGTAPGLFLVAFAGHVAARRWPRTVHGLSSLLMVANSAMIGLLVVRWVA